MVEIQLSDVADQEFQLYLEGKIVIMRVRWHDVPQRWHMDLVVEGEVKLLGRPIVVGSDLVDAFDFGIGRIFAWPATAGAEPTRYAFAERSVRLYQASEAEVIAAGIAA